MLNKSRKFIVAFVLVQIVISCMLVVDHRLFRLSSNMILNTMQQSGSASSVASGRHPFNVAYAFYVTEYYYSCFTLINVYRLINEVFIDDSVKIVLLVKKFIDKRTGELVNKTVKLAPDRIQVVYLDPANANLTHDHYYAQSYLKLEVFRQTQFQRLLFLDADGLILKNMDHLLFNDSLLVDQNLAMAPGYWFLPIHWLTSISILINPSESVYEKLRAYLSSSNFTVLRAKNKGHFDMDIINYVLGGQVEIMSKNYAMLDSYFEKEVNEKQFNQTFYVHFSYCKPSHYESRARGFLSSPQRPWTFRRLFQIYFSLHDQLCVPKVINN